MADPFVAEIRILPLRFAPKGWAWCNGQLQPISQNTALFSLIGTYYGGDGKSTFALPDLQGRAPMHPGQMPGSTIVHELGEMEGTETVTLLETEMAAHTHAARASNAPGDDNDPNDKLIARPAGRNIYAPPANLTSMAFEAMKPVGNGVPHNNMMPFNVLNFCIALQGVFPARQ